MNLKSTNTEFDKNKQELHQKDLNLKVPNDYFKSSRNSILEKTVHKKRKQKIIKMIIGFSSIAALFVITLTIFNNKQREQKQIAFNDMENDILISSLFVADQNVDNISDDYMLDLYDE